MADTPRPMHLWGLKVVAVPELHVCDGCAFNAPQFEDDSKGCRVSLATMRLCSIDKIIYIPPEQYPRWASRYALNKLE